MEKHKLSASTELALAEIFKFLEQNENHANKEGMKRFGILASKTYGVSNTLLATIYKPYKKNHELANVLWETGIHECKIIAANVGNPKLVTEPEMEIWLKGIENWADCDTLCGKLWCKAPAAYKKAFEWTEREPELEKRAGFALIATIGVHDKKAADSAMLAFFPPIVREANDNRNLVKKAISWALRTIGKRSPSLIGPATECANQIKALGSPAARWIASDALREFEKELLNPRSTGRWKETE